MKAVLSSSMLLPLLLLLSPFGANAEAGETEPIAAQTESFVWEELHALRGMVLELKEENTDLQSRLSLSEEELLSSKSRILQLERKSEDAPKVAFYTGMSDKSGPYDSDSPLRFSKVFTNIGKAYDPITGFFTAPMGGVYSIQFTVYALQPGHFGVKMFKNDQRIMFNYENRQDGGLDHINNSAVLELNAGDVIRLVLPSGYSLYDDSYNFSSFSGSLLFTM